MEWLFGHRLTPEEMLRKNQRALNKAMRDLDRERMKMEQQEKKVINDIKKLAKEGQMVRMHCHSHNSFLYVSTDSVFLLNTHYLSLHHLPKIRSLKS